MKKSETEFIVRPQRKAVTIMSQISWSREEVPSDSTRHGYTHEGPSLSGATKKCTVNTFFGMDSDRLSFIVLLRSLTIPLVL
jgi:hypothetical protein